MGIHGWVHPEMSLEFFRDTTKPKGASQNYQVHPRNIPSVTLEDDFFLPTKKQYKENAVKCADPMCQNKTSIELWFLHNMLQVSIGNYSCI